MKKKFVRSHHVGTRRHRPGGAGSRHPGGVRSIVRCPRVVREVLGSAAHANYAGGAAAFADPAIRAAHGC